MNYPRSHVRGIHAFNPSQISQASPSHRTKLQTYAQSNRVYNTNHHSKQTNGSKRDDSYSRRVAGQAHAGNLEGEQSASQNPEMEKRLRSLVTQVQKEDANRMSGTQFFRKLELNSLLIREKQQQQEQQMAAQQANMPIGATTCPVGGNNILGPQIDQNIGRKTLVLDLDETLVHSSFKPVDDADIVLPVEIEGNICYVYVLIRPGAQYFLERMAPLYEVVIYTASLSKYADPLLQKLDKTKSATYRLFREHCIFYNGVFVKDLSRLGRNLKDVIIIDVSLQGQQLELTSILRPEPRVCTAFDILVDDVRPYLKRIVKNNTINYPKAMDNLRKEQRRSSTVSAEVQHRRNLSHSQQIQLQPQLSPEQQRRGVEEDDDHKTRHTSLDTRRKPLMNTWTPSSLQKEKAQALHNNFQQTATPMMLSANLQDQQGYNAHRPTTTSGSTRAVPTASSGGYGYREHGSNALRASYNGTSGHQKQPLSQVLGPSYQHYAAQRGGEHPTHQRGHSAGAAHRASNERPNKHQSATAQGSSRKVTSSSTNTIRRAIQLNDPEMKYQGGGTGGQQNVSNTPSSVLTAETAMPSSQVNQRKISLGNQTPSHHSNTPSITSSTRPLMINLNRPASTKHNAGVQGGNRPKMPNFFTKAVDRENDTRGGYSGSGQYQYSKASGTPKAMKSASIGGTGGSKKGVHYHTLTQGSGYTMIPSSTRAHTASTRPTTTGSVFDVYMNQTGPQEFNNTTNLAMAMNVSSPSQSAVVNSTQFSAGSMKYGNLLKLSMGEELDSRGSSVGPEKMSGQTRHNSLPRNEKNSSKRIKTSKWRLLNTGSEKVRRSMKLGTPKYGANGGIPVELNPRTTTAGYVHHNGGSFNTGFSTQFISSGGYSHQQAAIHHPSTANNFISGTGMANRSQLQKHHQHHHSTSAANPRDTAPGQSKKALVRVARPSSGKKNQSMSAAISTNGNSKKSTGNTGPAGFFGDFFAVRNAQNKDLRGPVVVSRGEEPKSTELYSRFNS